VIQARDLAGADRDPIPGALMVRHACQLGEIFVTQEPSIQICFG
jgi:hypothetical protein